MVVMAITCVADGVEPTEVDPPEDQEEPMEVDPPPPAWLPWHHTINMVLWEHPARALPLSQPLHLELAERPNLHAWPFCGLTCFISQHQQLFC